MHTPLNPESGDVVVRQQHRAGVLVFVTGVVPGADQYLLPARRDAEAKARAFAREMRVRAWFADGSGHVTPLT